MAISFSTAWIHTRGLDDFSSFMNDYFEFTREVQERGIFEAGQPLEGVHTATTVRVRDDKTDISDGPFAETKEVLGGYYLLDCKDLDEALSRGQSRHA